MRKLKFAIAGTGSIAETHFKAIEETDSAEVVAVCSSNAERAAAAEKKFGVHGFRNIEEMLDTVKPDVLTISTASGRHLEPCIAGALRGIHILSEKPLEISTERGQRMIEICRANHVKLGCIFQNRFNPAVRFLKRTIAEGKLGKLLLGNAFINWYRPPEYYSSSPWRGTLEGDGGGALINQGIHTIDLLQFYMGEVLSLTGKVQTTIHQIEGEDLGLAMLQFSSGAMGIIEASTATYPGHPERLEIFGSKGSFTLSGGVITSWNLSGTPLPDSLKQTEVPRSGAADPRAIGYLYHKKQIEDFVTAINEKRDPAVTGEEGLKSVAIIHAIYQSSLTGKPFFLQ